jgi:hypothetical protein
MTGTGKTRGCERSADETTAAGQQSLFSATQRSDLTVDHCDLDYWFASAGRHFGALRHGFEPGLEIPKIMLEAGPLREAIFDEFAFRARSEEAATRSISFMIQCAPSLPTLDFYVTQLADEARHAYVFRNHLVDLGVPLQAVEQRVEQIVGERRHTILGPLEALARESADRGDFYGLVVILAVIAEGALAPAAEMSERKWRIFDPPAAQICEGANRDEIRHLAVGSSLIRDRILENPPERERLAALIARGMELWRKIPIQDTLVARELAFQKGIQQHAGLLGDYELVPGRALVDTTVEERLTLQVQWSQIMRTERLAFMGLASD